MAAVITSRQNGRVRELRAALRGRAAEGTAAIEGWTLLHEAHAAAQRSAVTQSTKAGLQIEAVFVREDRQAQAEEHFPALELVVLSSDVFDSIAATEQSQGIAAIVHKPYHGYEPAPNDLLVVAAGLQDPGNVGTLIRSAEALGARAVVLAEQTVDPWNAKALRASAGSAFRMPLPSWSGDLLGALRACGVRLLAAVPSGDGAVPVAQVDLRGGTALLIGNEGNGLSTEMLALADARITLPMPGPTESLNAAVAGSLLLYEAARQRGAA